MLLHPRTYCWSRIIFSNSRLIVGCQLLFEGGLLKMFPRYHLVPVSLAAGWLAVRPLGLIGDTKQRWAADISLENNLPWQIYFPGAHYDREQSALIVPETTQHYAAQLLDLRGNSVWLRKGDVTRFDTEVPALKKKKTFERWSNRGSVSWKINFVPELLQSVWEFAIKARKTRNSC